MTTELLEKEIVTPKLPEIVTPMIEATKYFAQVAKTIYPQAENDFIAEEAIELASLWLKTELKKVEKEWYREKSKG